MYPQTFQLPENPQEIEVSKPTLQVPSSTKTNISIYCSAQVHYKEVVLLEAVKNVQDSDLKITKLTKGSQ